MDDSGVSLEFRLAEQATELALAVSFPLRIVPRSVRTFRDNLAGEVIIELAVENASRRRQEGRAVLSTTALPDFLETRSLGAIEPGGNSVLSFVVTDLPTLPLLSGDVALDLRVLRNGVEQDQLTHHLPDAARDLQNRDLLLYLVRLAGDPGASPNEIARMRSLILLRLREDWKVAAMKRGNPYKDDFKRNRTETALGDLVQAYRAERDRIQRPEVFAGMSDDIVSLAGVLPGAHPFLRKYVRRLAGELP